MTAKSKSVLIVVLIIIIAIAGIFGWLVQAKKIKVGADVESTSRSVIPLKYVQKINFPVPQWYDGGDWTIIGDKVYLAGSSTLNNTVPFFNSYDLTSNKSSTLQPWPDVTKLGWNADFGGGKVLFLTSYKDQPYLFTLYHTQSALLNAINVFKYDQASNSWKQVQDGRDMLTGLWNNPITNESFWDSSKSKLSFLVSTDPSKKTNTFKDFDFTNESWVDSQLKVASYINFLEFPRSTRMIKQNDDLFLFGHDTAFPPSQATNDVTLFRDNMTTLLPSTFYSHGNLSGVAVKSNDGVYIFGSVKDVVIDANGVVTNLKDSLTSPNSEKYNLNYQNSYLDNFQFVYPAQKITPIPPKIIPSSAKLINGKIYLLAQANDPRSQYTYTLYEVQTGNVTTTTTTTVANPEGRDAQRKTDITALIAAFQNAAKANGNSFVKTNQDGGNWVCVSSDYCYGLWNIDYYGDGTHQNYLAVKAALIPKYLTDFPCSRGKVGNDSGYMYDNSGKNGPQITWMLEKYTGAADACSPGKPQNPNNLPAIGNPIRCAFSFNK